MTASPRAAGEWIPAIGFGDRLRVIRRNRHLSQEQIAAQLQVKKVTYSSWESGGTPSYKDVVEIADRLRALYGVPVAWTLGVHTETPRPGGPDGALSEVRHQGLEPRTRWFGRSGERRGFTPIADPTRRRHRRRYVVAPMAGHDTQNFEFSDNQVAELPHPRTAAETTAAFRWAA